MSHALSLRLAALTLDLPKKPLEMVTEAADLGALWLLRLALLAFVTYDGALIVRNVTHALCNAAGQTPPGWTGF